MTTSLAAWMRRLLAPRAACREVTVRVMSTVRHSQDLIRSSASMVVRPFLWPVHLSADLTRRVVLQVLVTLKEVLDVLDELIFALQHRLSAPEREELAQLDFKDTTRIRSVSLQQPSLPLSADQAVRAWRQHLTALRRLRQSNLALRRRLRTTETKYQELEAEVGSLKEMYSETLTTMDCDLNDLKEQRQHVLNIIRCAEALTDDCRGDAKRLMDELQTLGPADDLSSVDSLSLDLSLEGLTLTSQQLGWTVSDSDDTGYRDDAGSWDPQGCGDHPPDQDHPGFDHHQGCGDHAGGQEYAGCGDHHECRVLHECGAHAGDWAGGTTDSLPLKRVSYDHDVMSTSSSVTSVDEKISFCHSEQCM